MASKRFFTVTDGRHTVASGWVFDGPTRVNNTAINAGAAIAEILKLDVVAAVRVGKLEGADEFKPAPKDKVKDGESKYKAVAV